MSSRRFHSRWIGPVFIAALCGISANEFTAAQDAAPTPSASQTSDPNQMLDAAIEHIEKGELQTAATLVQQVSLMKPSLPKLSLAKGLLYVATNNSVEAVGEFGTYNRTDEGLRDYRGFAGLGNIYLRSRMYREAIDPLEQAARLAPLEEKGKSLKAQFTMNLASAYVNLERTASAVETATKAQAMAPRDADIQLQLAQIAAGANEYKLALDSVMASIQIFEKKIIDDAFNEDAHQKLRTAYGVLNSLIEYNRKREPKNGEHDLRLAQLLRDATELDRRLNLLKARQLVQLALTKNADNPDMLAMQAQIEFDLGAVADARATLEKAVQKHPQNEALKQMMAALSSMSERRASP